MIVCLIDFIYTGMGVLRKTKSPIHSFPQKDFPQKSGNVLLTFRIYDFAL